MTVPALNPQETWLKPRQVSSASPRHRQRTVLSRWFPVLLLLFSDVVAVNLAFFVSWFLRYELNIGGDVEPFLYLGYDAYLPLALCLAGLVVVAYYFGSLYRGQQSTFWFNDTFAMFGRCGFAVMALLAGATMVRYPASSRLTFVYVWLLATTFTAFGRLLVQALTGALHRRGIGSERVVVVGDNSLGRMVMQGVTSQPHLGLQVIGFLGEQREDDFGRFRYLGPVEKIEQVCGDLAIDQVIIALPSASHETQLRIMDHCRQAGVAFKLVPDLFEMSLSRIDLDSISGVPLIGLKEVSIEGWDQVMKRSLDLLLTLLALIPGSLVMLVVALLVRLDSAGPVIFRQTRIGKNGQPFTVFKFRSMRASAERELAQLLDQNEQTGPLFKKKQDPRLTRVGKWLRRASLDELPQLFNVLRGEMSLVGPRPGLPHEVEEYEDWVHERLKVTPGMTGLWQVSGRSSLNFEEMVIFDLAYVQNWSLSLDLSILLRTLPAVIAGRGAF